MVRSSLKKRNSGWLSSLLHNKYFGSCVDHSDRRRNEKNVFCIDCSLCFCKHCATTSPHCSHRRLQICKYVYHDVIRLQDMQKHFDCSNIQTYKINGEMAIHLNPRPQSKDHITKSTKIKNGAICEACRRHLHDFHCRFCSIACKVQEVMQMSDNQKKHKMICITDREKYEVKECKNYEGSSLSAANESSEVIQCSWTSTYASKPKKQLHKRKGVPRRAPLR